MKQLIVVFIVMMSVGSFGVGDLQADVWTEREALAKVEKELASSKALIQAAKSQRDDTSRTAFNYTALLRDIDTIREGITTHLAQRMEPVVPSSIDALQADYTEQHP